MTGKTRDIKQKTGWQAARDYAQETADLYDNIVGWYVASFWSDLTDQDWIEACLGQIPAGGSVADVGSGPGNYAQYFLARGHPTCCIDISQEMINEVRKRLPLSNAKVGDMRHLPLDDGSMDCVFCAYSINHVTRSDLGKVLSEFSRVAKQGGLVILFFKEGHGEYDFTARNVPGSRGLMTLFDRQLIIECLQSHGIRILNSKDKDDASRNEFAHRKVFLIGIKL